MGLTNNVSTVAPKAHRLIGVPGLPNELILNILAYLSWRNILRCRFVCRWLRDEIDRSVRLQYRIALGLSSLKDRPEVGPLASADRLQLLVAQQQAWRNLACCKIVPFRVPFISSIYDFVGGVFGKGIAGHPELHYIRLPSAMEVEANFQWSHMQFGFKITDFTVDIEQDLLILIELSEGGEAVRIHFWSLSTHTPHPAASRPTLEYPLTAPPLGDIRVQILGSHIGVIFHSSIFCEGGRLVIYSWTTGHTRAYVDAPVRGELQSFTFVSPCVFVIPWETTLDLYLFDPQSTIDPPPESEPLVSFKLPDGPLRSYYFECPACPYSNGGRSHLKDTINIPASAPFSVDSADGIIAFWIRAESDGMVCVVHRSTLLSYLNSWDNSHIVGIVDWHAWGPKNTRWFDAHIHPYWFHSVSGHRLVLVEPSVDDRARKFITIMDFNPVLISKELTRSVSSDLVTAPSLTGKNHYKTVIESELPYLETRSSNSFICSAALLDDHRVLLLPEVGTISEDATLLLP